MGFGQGFFSNGAAYADFDNDGDLDMIVNNINDEASLYKNTLMDEKPANKHYLSVKLSGDSLNLNGLGAWVELYYGSNKQVYEQTPYRGYLSSIQLNPHFGFGDTKMIDSLVVKWPDGSKQSIKNVAPDQIIAVDKKNARTQYNWSMPVFAQNTLFKEITDSLGIHFVHSQIDYIDFNIQRLLPHKFSEYGPSLASGDVNNDGLDDIVVGGNSSFGASVLLQQKNGSFFQRSLTTTSETGGEQFQDMGAILFDADKDGDLDLYIAR
ncbi:MAG: ASPIC/UnbV domain-containing protein, partial [Ferruginibacter sp.]